MYHIVYTEKAESDFSDIYRYIAEDSTERASAYLSRMEDCILGLRDFPGIGRTGRFPELTSLGVRMLPFEDYLIFISFARRKMPLSFCVSCIVPLTIAGCSAGRADRRIISKQNKQTKKGNGVYRSLFINCRSKPPNLIKI